MVLFKTKHNLRKHKRSLKGAVSITALLHKLCAPDLASIHTGRDSAAFSQPEEGIWLVNQVVLLCKFPNYVTNSYEWTKHMFSRFGNVIGYDP